MNVLFPGIPPIWEGSKGGKVGDGDDVVNLLRGGRYSGGREATDCIRICRCIKHHYLSLQIADHPEGGLFIHIFILAWPRAYCCHPIL